MITAFSLAPHSQIPPPLCASGEATAIDSCACYPRFRGTLSHKIPRGGTVLASGASDIVSVQCQNDRLVSWDRINTVNHPTAADVQVRPFVNGGRAFIKIIDGRVGRIVTILFNVVQTNGQVSSHAITLEII